VVDLRPASCDSQAQRQVGGRERDCFDCKLPNKSRKGQKVAEGTVEKAKDKLHCAGEKEDENIKWTNSGHKIITARNSSPHVPGRMWCVASR
jgi:hypothetical protein